MKASKVLRRILSSVLSVALAATMVVVAHAAPAAPVDISGDTSVATTTTGGNANVTLNLKWDTTFIDTAIAAASGAAQATLQGAKAAFDVAVTTAGVIGSLAGNIITDGATATYTGIKDVTIAIPSAITTVTDTLASAFGGAFKIFYQIGSGAKKELPADGKIDVSGETGNVTVDVTVEFEKNQTTTEPTNVTINGTPIDLTNQATAVKAVRDLVKAAIGSTALTSDYSVTIGGKPYKLSDYPDDTAGDAKLFADLKEVAAKATNGAITITTADVQAETAKAKVILIAVCKNYDGATLNTGHLDNHSDETIYIAVVAGRPLSTAVKATLKAGKQATSTDVADWEFDATATYPSSFAPTLPAGKPHTKFTTGKARTDTEITANHTFNVDGTLGSAAASTTSASRALPAEGTFELVKSAVTAFAQFVDNGGGGGSGGEDPNWDEGDWLWGVLGALGLGGLGLGAIATWVATVLGALGLGGLAGALLGWLGNDWLNPKETTKPATTTTTTTAAGKTEAPATTTKKATTTVKVNDANDFPKTGAGSAAFAVIALLTSTAAVGTLVLRKRREEG